MIERHDDIGFGLYVHWPFCQAKCPYCDFNSHVSQRIDQSRWLAAYQREIAAWGALTGPRVLRSVFFGGGTPSLMDPDTVGGVLETARATWPAANDLEITLEANPTSTETGRLQAFRDSGVNRVSIGLQALNDVDLKRLGRLHSAGKGLAAYDTARDVFERVSFDLIYARQDQSLAAWRSELTEALAREPDHLSLYQLTIEDGTAFGDRFRAGRLRGLPDADLGADLYQATQEICEAAGLPAYEVSNHARPGAESRHNMIYWQSGDWAGIGPGAHGRLTGPDGRRASVAVSPPGDWLSHAEAGPLRTTEFETLDDGARLEEMLIMGLRMVDGIDFDRVKRLASDKIRRNISDLVQDGYLGFVQGKLVVPSTARPLLNAVLAKVLV